MSLITSIKNKFANPAKPLTLPITKDMIIREVANQWPETVAVFGEHRVDFCCGGAHSIEQTAQARGCRDINALLKDLNAAVH